jgi:hypothetical protein
MAMMQRLVTAQATSHTAAQSQTLVGGEHVEAATEAASDDLENVQPSNLLGSVLPALSMRGGASSSRGGASGSLTSVEVETGSTRVEVETGSTEGAFNGERPREVDTEDWLEIEKELYRREKLPRYPLSRCKPL